MQLQLATQAGETLTEINEVSQNLEELVERVSSSALRQSEASKLIADKMREISEATRQSADQSRNSTAQVTSLADLAYQLGESVSRFSLEHSEEEIEEATEHSDTLVPPVGFEAGTAGAPATF